MFKSILFKMALPVIIIFTMSIMIFSFIIYYNFKDFAKQEKEKYTEELTQNYKDSLKKLVTLAYKIAEYNYKKYPNDEEKAKRLTKEAISNMRYGKSGYFFAYQKNKDNYTFAFHSVKPKLNGKVANLEKGDIKGYKFRKALVDTSKGDNNFVEYYYSKPGTNKIIKKMAYSKYFAPWKWSIVTGVYIDDIEVKVAAKVKLIKEQTQKFYSSLIFMSLILALVFTAAFIFIGKKLIIKPIKLIASTLKEISEESDIDKIRVDESREDEFKDVMKNINLIIEKYGNMFNLLKNKFIELANESKKVNEISKDLELNSNILKNESDNLKNISLNSNNNINDVNNMIKDSLKKIKTMDRNSKIVEDKMKENENLVKDVVDYSNSMATSIEEMISTISEISKSSVSAINVADNVQDKTINLKKHMDILKEHSKNIGEFTEIIKAIASQTNLLALNATIEAARAGEAGKGFVVVANEIKNLAMETNNATVKIEKQINDIQTISNSVSGLTDETNEVVHEIKEAINSISSSLQEQEITTSEVSKNIFETNNRLDKILDYTKDVIVSTEKLIISVSEVKDDIDNIAEKSEVTKSISDEVSGAGETVYGIVDKLNGITKDISDSSEKLLDLSNCKFI